MTAWKTSHGATCRHKLYRLSCLDFESLSAETNHLCTLCAAPPEASTHGVLTVDHDRSLGFWAVRGLLCAYCNINLERPGNLPPADVERYLADPWHVRVGRLRDPNPAPIPEIPQVDQDAAMDMLREATRKYKNAISYGSNPLQDERRRELLRVVQVAAKSGIRPTNIITATNRLITYEQIYAVRHVRGRRVA